MMRLPLASLLIVALAAWQCCVERAEAVTVTGVTIYNVSSQLTTSFNRGAIRVLDGSGLAGGLHTNSPPDGTMWLNSGNGCCGDPADPFVPGTGAQITFDLGANYDLTSFHVWNYNEVGLPGRGANAVQIQTASTNVAPVFSTFGNVNFPVAPGTAGYAGVDIPLLANNVRLVRFNISSNHGGDNEFIGLSEIRFEAAVPEPAAWAMWGIFGLVGAAFFWRRYGKRQVT